jgi:DNA-binding NtrC family response regulator
LISDVLLPGIDGLTLATLIRSQRPELRTLFISGHAREQVLPVEVEATAFLAKPFTYDALLDTVTDLLSPSGPLRRAVAPEE